MSQRLNFLETPDICLIRFIVFFKGWDHPNQKPSWYLAVGTVFVRPLWF